MNGEMSITILSGNFLRADFRVRIGVYVEFITFQPGTIFRPIKTCDHIFSCDGVYNQESGTTLRADGVYNNKFVFT